MRSFVTYSATIRGGLTSGGIGLTVALVASLAANSSRYPAFKSYRALTLPLKAFAVTAATTASFIIGADSASRQFELNKYRIGSGTALEEQAYRDLHAEELLITEESGAKRAIDLRTLSTRDAIVEWAKAHRYAVVFGAWAATMVGSFGYISMTPLSFSQKLVQVRRSRARLYRGKTQIDALSPFCAVCRVEWSLRALQ